MVTVDTDLYIMWRHTVVGYKDLTMNLKTERRQHNIVATYAPEEDSREVYQSLQKTYIGINNSHYIQLEA